MERRKGRRGKFTVENEIIQRVDQRVQERQGVVACKGANVVHESVEDG